MPHDTQHDDTLTQHDDGGPAFPWEDMRDSAGLPRPHPGMSLRDWFAGQAMVGMLANTSNADAPNDATLSKWAYSMADAMIATRNR